ncbi:MAG: ABC transporter permease [Myxococcota bacterium]
MHPVQAFREALRLLWAHKGRASLTLFGLVWGTASVIFLMGWGAGVTRMLEDGFERTGKNLGQAWPGRISEDYTPAVDRRYLWFDMEDVERVRRRSRLAELVAAETQEYLPFAYAQRAFNLDTRGVEPQGMEIRGVTVASGRAITVSDVKHRRRVVVLGHRARQRLLGAGGAVGSWVRVAGTPFRVVGVLERVGTQLGRDGEEIDDQAWVPISTFQVQWPRWWTDDAWVEKVIYRMPSRHLEADTEREIRALLAEGLGVSPTDEEAVRIWSPVKMLSELPLDQMRGFLFVLATATLVIGGVGTLNMMLDSVHERRQEIGVRMAVGARARDVLFQFFLETFTVVSLGGLLGVALGAGACALLARLHVPDLVPVPVVSGGIVATALVVMGTVGVLAGVVPAWRASRVDPAVTLRMD